MSIAQMSNSGQNRTYACPECNDYFQTMEQLVTHHRNRHDENTHRKLLKYYIPALISLRRTCVFCNMKFSTKSYLNKHYKQRCKRARVTFRDLSIAQIRGLLAWNDGLWLPKQYFGKVHWYLSLNEAFLSYDSDESKENSSPLFN